MKKAKDTYPVYLTYDEILHLAELVQMRKRVEKELKEKLPIWDEIDQKLKVSALVMIMSMNKE